VNSIPHRAGVKRKDMDNLLAAAAQFAHRSVTDITEFGNGNINKTFLVTTYSEKDSRFVLQRINTHVFPRADLVMMNMRVATEHFRQRLNLVHPCADRRWEVPYIIPAHNGNDYWRDSKGSFWRAIAFIESSQPLLTIKDSNHAGEVGYALGFFHTLLSDLSPDKLADTLPGFHVTPLYLRHYEEVIAKCPLPNSPEVKHCVRFIGERIALSHVLEDARQRGELFLRPIHGDPKVANILIDATTGHAIGVVDLDTVKPGLVHYDIGDCLRSSCNTRGEEIEEWEDACFDAILCRAVLEGYLSLAGGFLTPNDIFYVYDSLRMITFELGLRYFTDYLEGNVYFKVKRPDHNLLRALVQFRLAESIESQEKDIRDIIREVSCTAFR
jgi:Ser/Thr protein kinase RdoA (MazF antagonist)